MTEDDDLDALVTELNTVGSPEGLPYERAGIASHPAMDAAAVDVHLARLRAWLEHVVERGGSDLLLRQLSHETGDVQQAPVPDDLAV